MKLGITKEQIPILVDRSVMYLGGILFGIGGGMLLAVGFFPEENRQMFHLHYYLTACAFETAGLLTVGVVANLVRRRFPRKDLINENLAV